MVIHIHDESVTATDDKMFNHLRWQRQPNILHGWLCVQGHNSDDD